MKKQFFFAACMLFFFLSCTITVSNASFIRKMDEADAFVSVGDTKSALKILHKLSNGSYSAQQRLGIYRRFEQLGEFDSAEKCLQIGLKDIPNNAELTAVYVWHLLERGRLSEAEALSQKLSGSRYGALGTEILFRTRSAGQDAYDRALLPFFTDAWAGTKNDAWLMNAAVLHLLDGKMQSAARLAPGIATTVNQAIFWGCVLLDADYPLEALGYLDAAGKILSYMDPYGTAGEAGSGANSFQRAAILALTADAYARQDELHNAKAIWQQLTGEDAASTAQSAAQETASQIPAVIFYNLAKTAKADKNSVEWYTNLMRYLSREQNSLYALTAYADYALEQASAPSEESLQSALRSSGLSSRGMSLYDTIPRVPYEDVLVRLKETYAATKSTAAYVEYLKFSLASQQAAGRQLSHALPIDSKDAWLWDALEAHYSEQQGYPAELARFAFSHLLFKKKNADARQVFELYIAKRYGLSGNAQTLSEKIIELLPRLSSWECEAFAWIAAEDGAAPLAARLYEYLYGEIHEVYPEFARHNRYQSSFEVVVNLAEIYIAAGRKERAGELYRQALSLESDGLKKAELLYRLAEFQHAQGETRQALVNLEYCLTLDPDHRLARALQKKIR